jgi:putative flippase GtrA
VQFARFVVVGAVNTAASYAVYLLLLPVVDYRLAYTIAYVGGLVGGYLAHARFVFGARPGARSAASYLATYGAMYLASLAVLHVVVDMLRVPKALGMLAALAVTVPASFVLLRWGFRGPPSGGTRGGAGGDGGRL